MKKIKVILFIFTICLCFTACGGEQIQAHPPTVELIEKSTPSPSPSPTVSPTPTPQPIVTVTAKPEATAESADRKNYYNADGDLNYYYIYEFDDEGEIISHTLYDASGSEVESWSEYKYDSVGRESTVPTFDEESGKVSGFCIYEYNEASQLYTEIYYNLDGYPLEKAVNFYDALGLKERAEIYNADGSSKWNCYYEYDSDGRVIKEECRLSSDYLVSYAVFEYDEDGNCTRMDYDKNGNVM